MKLYVSPAKTNGELCVPGSKSHTIRAVVIATLAKGKSVIEAPLVSEDTLSCLKAASTFGAWVKRGAGDAFCAGILYAAEMGMDMENALKLGACSAAASLSEVSASDGVKTAQEVLKLYDLYG